MNDDYEELPCPETNTFKPGDLVMVYGSSAFPDIARVIDFEEFGEKLKFNDQVFLIMENSSSKFTAHYKCCRPLKKKEPPKVREFFIYPPAHCGVDHLQAEQIWSGTGLICKTQDRCDSCGRDFNK